MTIEIDSAAIKWEGVIYTLPRPNRHSDLLRHFAKMFPDRRPVFPGGEQGFLTNELTPRFVNRRDALLIARDAGQLRVRGLEPSTSRELFTEDLW